MAAVFSSLRRGIGGTNIVYNGITWSLAGSLTNGTYINGDPWVLDPGGGVTVNSVSPGWDGSTNGSEVNPPVNSTQSFDNRGSTWTFSSGNRATFPLSLDASGGIKSLVSTIGLGTPEGGGGNSYIDRLAILTVVSSTPAANSFRPSFVDGAKPTWNISDLNLALLPSVSKNPAGKTVITRNLEKGFDTPSLSGGKYPWIDHGPNNVLSQMRPTYQQPSYHKFQSALLSRWLAYTITDAVDKNNYVYRLVQHGIDLYEIQKANAQVFGHSLVSGKKACILYAGCLLEDTGMLTLPKYYQVGSLVYKFTEDAFTYYGSGSVARFGADCVQKVTEGMPTDTWSDSNTTCRDPSGATDNPNYMSTEAPAWPLEVLAMEALDLVTIWDHDAWFDFVDRWVATPSLFMDSSTTYLQDVWGYAGDGDTEWAKAMFDTYRGTF